MNYQIYDSKHQMHLKMMCGVLHHDIIHVYNVHVLYMYMMY